MLLWRLLDRIVKVGLALRDPRLMPLDTDARDAMRAPSVELHYQSCGHGVGRPPAECSNAG